MGLQICNGQSDLFAECLSVEVKDPLLDPLKDSDIDEFILDVSSHLLDQLANTLLQLERDADPENFRLTPARKRFAEELCWVFDLWKSVFTFEAACAFENCDAEDLRRSIAHKFAREIRIFWNVIRARDKALATAVARNLGEYVVLKPLDNDEFTLH